MKNKKLLTACLLAGVAIGLNSCAEGDYNDLKCDSKYEAECLDASHYMSCQNGTLIVTTCGAGTYCKEKKDEASGAVSVACESYETDKPAQCDHESPVCINDSLLETCKDGKAEMSQCDYGCEAGACKDAPASKKDAGESCTANEECKSNSCVPVAGGEAGEMECAPDASCTTEGATRCTEDGSAMETCTDNVWTATSCGELGCKNDKCLLADGEECESDDVCGSGFCAEEKIVDGAEGGACREIAEGAVGDVCDAGLVCKDDVCTKLVEGMEGGACREIAEGADGDACDAGLVCNTTTNLCEETTENLIERYCKIAEALAGPEDADINCKTEIAATIAACGENGRALLVCMTDYIEGCSSISCLSEPPAECMDELAACIPEPGTEGGECRDNTEENITECEDGLVCNEEGICEKVSGPKEGEKGGACRDNTEANVIACDEGLECLSDVCVDKGSKGTSCVADDAASCLEGLECTGSDADSMVCTPKAGYADGACRDDSVENITKCEAGLSCVSDVCVAEGSKGAACRDNSVENVIACDAGLKCDENVCVEIVAGAEGGVCREIAEGADGLACDAGLVCTENVCVKLADGAEGGACLEADGAEHAEDYCNDGLVCNEGICEAPAQSASSSAPEGRKHVCTAKLADGDACDNGSHCASGNCEEGVCTAKLAGEGESCENVECKDGLACNDSKVCEQASTPADACSDDSTCGAGKKCVIAEGATEGTCQDVPAGEAGGACRNNTEENITPCEAGLSCVSNVCVANGAEGAPCREIADGADGLPCDAGLVCDEESSVCKKPVEGTEGAACREIAEDAVGDACDAGLVCDEESNVCKKPVEGTEGAACRVIAEGADGDACDAGLVCDEESNVCKKPVEGTEGAACREIAEGADGLPCDSGLVCDEESNVCKKDCRVDQSCEVDDVCNENEDCVDDLVCTYGKCRELTCQEKGDCPEGETCNDNDECGDDLVCGESEGMKVCAKTCSNDDDCEVGVCDDEGGYCRKGKEGEACNSSLDCEGTWLCDGGTCTMITEPV